VASKPPFTIETPRRLPVTERGGHWYADLADRELRLSNLDKVFWPDEGYTKGDLINYYFNIAPTMLPYLRDRPLTMKRMPDGITGNEFYEKNAPSHTPEWIARCPVPSGEARDGLIDYLMANDEASLLFIANLGCIEFHPLHSRCARPDLPDYLFFDLDPFDPPNGFADVLAVAHHVHAALDSLGLPSYPKTSGATGMQIYVPIIQGPTYEQVREFVRTIGRAIRSVDPERTTLEPKIANRTGKVYIDHNMNRMGANIAAVYSVRPGSHAPVSTPLRWDEVAQGEVRPQDFTLATIHERLERMGDLFRGLLDEPVDIGDAMVKLGVDAEDKLAAYDRKRDFAKTPEPAPTIAPGGGDRFVIQKHAARRLHYDLRLEHEGVLWSWAVPKGLPSAPGERRLAVRTEDHPLPYLDFEATIPKGNYGAGEMRIFDKGTYEMLEDEEKKLTVRLHGERVRGEYHMVNTSADQWLVFLSRSSQPVPPPPPLRPMLAEAVDEPFDDPKWTFEPKLDGVRTLAYVSTDHTTLYSRTGRDQTARYPELANLATYVNALHAVLDGEIVVLGPDGQPSFSLLQQRINITSSAEVDRARKAHPVVFYVFDIVWLDERDLTTLPLTERRQILHDVVTPAGPLAFTYTVDGEGKAFYEAAKGLGLEGIVGKKLDSIYEQGKRSHNWRKIKALRSVDAVVIGWTPGGGSRSRTFGALLLGAYDGAGVLRWIGQVGTGFTGRVLDAVQAELDALEVGEPPSPDPELRDVKGARWVRPELVAEVLYLEVTRGGKLRAPAFRGLRPDIDPSGCRIDELIG
jgi:DNA ligase D-like protein (predicted ligase)/DNA ligase D-like protein (predicted polymerase)/DNA ligase D-like protein (predicted 3'-phosphoesterase)